MNEHKANSYMGQYNVIINIGIKYVLYCISTKLEYFYVVNIQHVLDLIFSPSLQIRVTKIFLIPPKEKRSTHTKNVVF